jgi:26S proteasome non-ATPase regulatory subunit 10
VIRKSSKLMLEELLKAGADVNIDRGRSLVHACGGSVNIVEALLDAGAELHCQEDVAGNALKRAAYWANKDICRILIDNGADVNALGGEEG